MRKVPCRLAQFAPEAPCRELEDESSSPAVSPFASPSPAGAGSARDGSRPISRSTCRCPGRPSHGAGRACYQSLSVPPGAVAFLPLGPKSFDILPTGGEIPGADRAQGVALELGRGRVVVLGEAAMLTAQVTGRAAVRFGMNLPGNDDRQLALNIIHWLARTI